MAKWILFRKKSEMFSRLLFFHQAIIIGSYIIASAFFSVYNMAVDTLFLCFRKFCHLFLAWPFLVLRVRDEKPNGPCESPAIVVVVWCKSCVHAVFSLFSPERLSFFIIFCVSVEDLERHDGSEQKPYYMSKELMKILGTKNKIPRGDKKK